MAEVAREHTVQWQELGVALFHRLLIENLLRGKDLPKPRYVHFVQEVVDGLKSSEFPLAALVMPATVSISAPLASPGSGCRRRALISILSCSAGWLSIRWNNTRFHVKRAYSVSFPIGETGCFT